MRRLIPLLALIVTSMAFAQATYRPIHVDPPKPRQRLGWIYVTDNNKGTAQVFINTDDDRIEFDPNGKVDGGSGIFSAYVTSGKVEFRYYRPQGQDKQRYDREDYTIVVDCSGSSLGYSIVQYQLFLYDNLVAQTSGNHRSPWMHANNKTIGQAVL